MKCNQWRQQDRWVITKFKFEKFEQLIEFLLALAYRNFLNPPTEITWTYAADRHDEVTGAYKPEQKNDYIAQWLNKTDPPKTVYL